VRRLLIAFALGAAAAAVAEVLVFVAVAIAADANGWSSFVVGSGPFVLLEFERTPSSTAMTFGGGMGAIVLLAGALNAAGSAFLARPD
jgi:hypothetical protein